MKIDVFLITVIVGLDGVNDVRSYFVRKTANFLQTSANSLLDRRQLSQIVFSKT